MTTVRYAVRLPVLVKYPYLVSLREFLNMFFGYDVSLEYLLSISAYVERAKERIKAYIKDLNYVPTNREDVEVISFYLGLIATKEADVWANHKFIDSESKISRKYLLLDSEEVVSMVARKVGIDLEYLGSNMNRCGKSLLIGVDVKTGRKVFECYPFRISIPKYIESTEKLSSDPKWKLVNKYVIGGYVYIVKNEATRLIEEFVKRYLTELSNTLDTNLCQLEVGNSLCSYVRELVREVRGFTSDEAAREYQKLRGIIREEFFPPCIARIKEAAARGEHLSHHQRFALATFLLNIGMEPEDVLNIFKNLPDFNERIARYQIEHLAGIRGSRKKYLVYSCEKMRTLGLCVSNCGVKNPLSYYWKALRSAIRRGVRDQEEEG